MIRYELSNKLRMRKYLFIFVLTSLWTLAGYSQSSIELIPSVGMSAGDNITYERCTGRIDPAFVFSFSFIYHPSPVVGLELSYLDENPFTYLSSLDNPSIQVYTSSKIAVQRLLGGVNFSIPVKKFRPYLGCLLGFTYANTANLVNTGRYTGFTWALQTGADYYISSLIGMRLKIAMIQTSNVPNNSAYFDVGKNGEGFPTFAVGDPSSANLRQVNVALGIIFHFHPNTKPR
jgi:hypothetical protein